ncbi:MAG: bifunctional diguanylate cyclase/phosphodiesterase [Firmicutes bacterium]|nr:bifunctional diguanylate cyclase/phosphodiesterase [Bacillota bacterium]
MTEAIREYVRELSFYARRMEYLAERDPLTGLFNRTVLPRRLKNAIELAKVSGLGVAVMFVDLDDFKAVNDKYGHDTGDALLVEIGLRFPEHASDICCVIRQGGDEFVVILEGVSGEEDVIGFVDRFFAALSQPIDVGPEKITITASIGISLFPEHGDSVDTLLRQADIAMFGAKAVPGNSFCFYEKKMEAAAQDQVRLTDELDRALRQDELKLYFQPIVECSSLVVWGVEALIRWQHPQQGVLLPGQFLPVAEASGLIIHIDKWVLEAACIQVLRHFGEGDYPTLFVNLSGQHLKPGSGLVNMVIDVLEKTNFNPRALVIEITETTLVENIESATTYLMELRRLGIRVALDDFGEGYSSLAYLANLPVDILKISGHFADRISQHAKDIAVIDTVIDMAKKLEISIVVEGIEVAHQMEFFARRGCDLAQGFYFGKPCPIYELTDKSTTV